LCGALGEEEDFFDDPTQWQEKAVAALDRLAARLQEAERERDEALGIKGLREQGLEPENYITPVQKILMERRRAEAAEAREAALREALSRALASITLEFYAGNRGRTADILRTALALPPESEEPPTGLSQ